MQLYNSLRPRNKLLTENESIAESNEKKFAQWAKLPDTPKYK